MKEHRTFNALLLAVFFMYCPTAFSQDNIDRTGIEVSAGAAMIIYQSGYAMENAPGVEVAARGKVVSYLSWQAGTRVWFNPVSPEVFARILVSEKRGAWTPFAGIELGVTGRGKFGEGSQLLRETRNAMMEDINPFYLSSHIAPLSFTLNVWRLSAAEITFGSHFENMGRTLRLQITAISISRTF
jgi:hypothetical protein